jgi:hypothetical protein
MAFSLSSIRMEKGRGEEDRLYWVSPLPNPLLARASRREGEDPTLRCDCLIQWQCTPALSPSDGEREKMTTSLS